MIGARQVPVSDVAVTASSFTSHYGEAMSIGERPILSIINPAASARIIIAESITNILAADIEKISNIKLSANWMAASDHKHEDAKLYEMVKTVGMEFCPELNFNNTCR